MAHAAVAGLSARDLDYCDFAYLNALLLARRDTDKNDWERARMVAFFAVKPYDSQKNLRKFSDLVEFPWEKSPVLVEQKETIEEFLRKTAQAFELEGIDDILKEMQCQRSHL